jgi:hypothetical protein
MEQFVFRAKKRLSIIDSCSLEVGFFVNYTSCNEEMLIRTYALGRVFIIDIKEAINDF